MLCFVLEATLYIDVHQAGQLSRYFPRMNFLAATFEQ